LSPEEEEKLEKQAAMGPVVMLSTWSHEEIHHNITACISPPYLLLTDFINITKHSTGREFYYEIHCEHCILTNCINNS
jgi:hypothetical protein